MIRPYFLAKSKLLIESSFRSRFFTLKAKLTFAKLRQVFIKVLNLYYFDPKYSIYIKTNISCYTISEDFS